MSNNLNTFQRGAAREAELAELLLSYGFSVERRPNTLNEDGTTRPAITRVPSQLGSGVVMPDVRAFNQFGLTLHIQLKSKASPTRTGHWGFDPATWRSFLHYGGYDHAAYSLLVIYDERHGTWRFTEYESVLDLMRNFNLIEHGPDGCRYVHEIQFDDFELMLNEFREGAPKGVDYEALQDEAYDAYLYGPSVVRHKLTTPEAQDRLLADGCPIWAKIREEWIAAGQWYPRPRN